MTIRCCSCSRPWQHLALTLIVLRLLPIIMAIFAWIAARTRSVGFLLATRYLARDPGFYTTPLVLLMLTLGLSVFTASLAQTLDNHLYDKNFYAVGADARLVEMGATNQSSMSPFGAGAAGDSGAARCDGVHDGHRRCSRRRRQLAAVGLPAHLRTLEGQGDPGRHARG